MRLPFKNSMGVPPKDESPAALKTLLEKLLIDYTPEEIVALLRVNAEEFEGYTEQFKQAIYDSFGIIPEAIDLPGGDVSEGVLPAEAGLDPDVVRTSSVIFSPEEAASVFAAPAPEPVVQTAEIPASSDAGQFFKSLYRYKIADIYRDADGTWHFKMLNRGWIGVAMLGGWFVWSNMKRPAPRRRYRKRTVTRKRKLKRA